jgi:hypothetical protein
MSNIPVPVSSRPRTPDARVLSFDAESTQSHKSPVSSPTASKAFTSQFDLSNYVHDVHEALSDYCSALEKLSSNDTKGSVEFDASIRRLRELNISQNLIVRFEKTYTALQAHQRALHPVISNPNIRLNTGDDSIFRKNGNKELCIEDLEDSSKEELFFSLYNLPAYCNSSENPTGLLTPGEYFRLVKEGYDARISSSSQSQVLLHAPTPLLPRLLEQSQGTGLVETSSYPDTPPPGPGQHLSSTSSSDQEFNHPADSFRSSSSDHSDIVSPTSGSMEPHTLIGDPLQNQGSPTTESPEGIRGHSLATPTLQFHLSSSRDFLLSTGSLMLLGDTGMSSIHQNASYDSENSLAGELLGLKSIDLSCASSEDAGNTSPTAGIDGFLGTPCYSETSTVSPPDSDPLSTFSPNREANPVDSPGSFLSYHSNTRFTASPTFSLKNSFITFGNPLQNQGSPTSVTPEVMRDLSSDTSHPQFHLFHSSKSSPTKGNLTRPYQTTISSSPSQTLPDNYEIYSDYNPFDSHSLRLDIAPSKHTKKKSPTAGTNYFLETPRQFETSTKAPSPPLSTFSSNQESTSPADSTASSLSDPLNTGSTPSNTLGSTESPGLLNNPLQNLGSPTSKTPETPERIRCSSDISHMQSPSSSSSKFSYTIHGSPTSYQTTMSNSSSISSDYNPLQAFSVHLSNEPSEHTQKKSPTAGIDGFLKLLFKPLEPITKAVGASQSRASNHQPVPRELPNNSSVLYRKPHPPISNPSSPKKKPEEGGILNFLCSAFAPKAVAPRADIRGNVTSAVYV